MTQATDLDPAEPNIVRGEAAPSSGYERVLAFLRDQLLSGRLRAGDRLLSERDLATQLGVSRPVIREALRALAAFGAVDIRHGQGTVVRRPDLSAFGEFFSFVLAQQADAVEDVMEARVAIELHAIRLACRRAGPSDLDQCEEALRRIVATIDNVVEGGRADFHFHEVLVRAAHSPTLSSIYVATSNLLMHSHIERRREILDVEGIETFLIDHHRAIFSALVARDVEQAEKLLRAHFEIGGEFRRRARISDAARRYSSEAGR
jgi:GntR family transcriptional repressor for pyruvate dehydrogenase complex